MRTRRLEWWHRTAVVLLLFQCVLFLLLRMRPGELGIICWYFASDVLLWLGVTGLLFIAAIVQSARRRPFWTRWRAAGFGLLMVLALWPMMYRTYPSSHDDTPSQVRFRIPMDGRVTVAWGGATPDVNYHVIAPDQRWAYDLLVTQQGKTHRGDGTDWEDYYCYGMPLLAPAEGVVVAAHDEAPDMPIGVLGGTPAGGNQVVLEVGPDEFLFLCHLKPESITVAVGDRVEQGQTIARIGNSGNSSEPHLHIHLQDTSEDDFGEGIPLYFHGYRVGEHVVDRGIPTGGFDKRGRLIGQIIEHVEPMSSEGT